MAIYKGGEDGQWRVSSDPEDFRWSPEWMIDGSRPPVFLRWEVDQGFYHLNTYDGERWITTLEEEEMAKKKWTQKILFSIVTRDDGGRIKRSYDFRVWHLPFAALVVGALLWV